MAERSFLSTSKAFNLILLITISNVPLELFGATGNLVAQLGFPLEQFTVNPTNARPISLRFPKSVFTKKNQTGQPGIYPTYSTRLIIIFQSRCIGLSMQRLYDLRIVLKRHCNISNTLNTSLTPQTMI
ncbi:SLAP domain-containing protein [Psychrobacillus mangrovi]|uniref:SLAP domain-containing protein n=1 Tax=Psychrobacillus mangrovi TaxID=3117745 RepID=UPI0039B77239